MTQIPTGQDFRPEYFNTIFECRLSPLEFPAQFAIITAYNPDGKLTPWENKRRDQALDELLQNRGIIHWRITGGSPDGSHQEPGYAVPMAIHTAIALGRQFEQEAIFWIDNDELTLVSCRELTSVALGSFAARLRASA